MSSSGENQLVFKSQSDVTIFVSCISGVFGLILILAFIGFVWEQCSFVKKNRALKKRRKNFLNSQTFANKHAHEGSHDHQHHDPNCENHYPTWLYNTMVHEQAQIMQEYLQNGEPANKQQSNHYPESYIDEVFSDIFDDNGKGNKPGKGLSYEPRNKMITPEKKPALPVPYYKEDKRDNDSDKDKKLRKISMEDEKFDRHKDESSGGFAIALDDLNLDLFDKDDSIENKESTKIFIPKELTVGEKIKSRQNNQSVEYENPKILEKERLNRLREEQHFEEMRARRITMERSISDVKSKAAEIQKPVKRIGIPVHKKPTFPTVEENQNQDAFLF